MDDENLGNRDKLLDHIINDFDEAQRQRHSKEELEARVTRRCGLIRKFMAAFYIIVTVGIVGYLFFFIFGRNAFIQNIYMRFMGARISESYSIDGCVFNMWRVKKAVNLYFAQHASFPADIETLYTQGYISDKVVCPASGAEYIVKERDGKTVFCCPNPAEHGVSRICADAASGVPVIER